jgi:sulfur carrier protein ThiS
MKNLLIRPNANIKDALQQLSITGEKCLVVVDKKITFWVHLVMAM